jgi:DNA-binding transcriptional MocR family regulator
MSWQATAWALHRRTGKPTHKLTLLAVANYADERGRCWPSHRRLADDTEQSVDTVQRHLKALAAAGLVEITKQDRFGGHWPGCVYQLAMPHQHRTEPQPGRPPCRTAMRHE